MAYKVALVQPIIPLGKSIGIKKSPESIQALAGQCEPLYETRMFHEQADDALYQSLSEFQPDVVGISTMTPNFPAGKTIAKVMKSLFPNVPVILGGWHASGCAQAFLQGQEEESLTEILHPHSPFDYIVAGEGDVVFPELLRRLSCGASIHDLQGVGYCDVDRTLCVSVADRIDDLKALNDPSWAHLPIYQYRDDGNRCLDLSIHANRGCRFQCHFCSTSTVCPGRVRTLSAQRTVQYLTRLIEEFHPRVITFTDEDFFANPKWVRELVDLLSDQELSKKHRVIFDTFASVLDIYRFICDLEKGKVFLKKMKEAGFDTFTIGVESLCSSTLLKYHKELMIIPLMEEPAQRRYQNAPKEKQLDMLLSVYLRRVQRSILFAHDHDFYVIGDYIIGYPEESFVDLEKGFQMFCDFSHLFAAYLPIYTPFPGTGLWKEAYESGKLFRDSQGYIDWARFDASSAVMGYDYDVVWVRDNFESQFYSSERYINDMNRELTKNPKRIRFFLGRYRRLASSFPDNPFFTQQIQTLKAREQRFITDGFLAEE